MVHDWVEIPAGPFMSSATDRGVTYPRRSRPLLDTCTQITLLVPQNLRCFRGRQSRPIAA
jgi:hypothetical protein